MSSSGDARDQTFGSVVRRLRGDLTQEQFSAIIGVSRSLVAQAEVEHRVGPALVEALLVAYPAHSAELRNRYERLRVDTVKHPDDELRRIDALITGRRPREAIAALENRRQRGWPTLASGISPEETSRLAHLYLDVDDRAQTLQLCTVMLERGDNAIGLIDEVAARLQRMDDPASARTLIDAALLHHLRDPVLWRRRGIIAWYEMKYADAFSDLTAALQLGGKPQRMLHARGQVLADWDQAEWAVEELEVVIAGARSVVSRAYALSAYAYALVSVGRTTEGLAAFDDAQLDTPENAWLHYRRALAYNILGDSSMYRKSLEQSLKCRSPHLSAAMREAAVGRLARRTGDD